MLEGATLHIDSQCLMAIYGFADARGCSAHTHRPPDVAVGFRQRRARTGCQALHRAAPQLSAGASAARCSGLGLITCCCDACPPATEDTPRLNLSAPALAGVWRRRFDVMNGMAARFRAPDCASGGRRQPCSGQPGRWHCAVSRCKRVRLDASTGRPRNCACSAASATRRQPELIARRRSA